MSEDLLPRIHSPQDLKHLSREEMEHLASEMRREIIRVVSENGGHLASSLGVVELTIALHLVFDAPKDKIIWDVGHQSYGHKLLTGRFEKFSTLRKKGGLSGFPKMSESPYDTFGTGHSSTSISAGVGMAVARDLMGENYKVVSIIGDGALTGGMAFEALNHCGHLGKDLVVILNDNEMSISPNVGAMSEYLTRLRIDPTVVRAKADIEYALRRIPSIGPAIFRAARRFKDSLKYLLLPGMLFEEMGFKYYGPIDGHDLNLLITTLREVKSRHDPVLIHVLTRKGKGYLPAEKDASRFHGPGPFVIETGEPRQAAKANYTSVFGETMVRLGADNPKLLAITAAMPDGTGLVPFSKAYPDRFFDVGIAEQHALTFAAGLAAQGYHPVVAIYSTFYQRAYDQIIHDVCLQNLPVTMAVDRGGLVGEDGATHHGAFDLSYLRVIPNLVIMAPGDEEELRRMLVTAVQTPAPVAVRYPRAAIEGVPQSAEPEPLSIGRGEVRREGKDLTIVAIGSMVREAVTAAEKLAAQGVDAAVINARFVKPLDKELIRTWAEKTRRVVTLEENTLAGGFGSGVVEMLVDSGLEHVSVLRLGLPDRFVSHGTRKELLEEIGLNGEGIAASIQGWLRRNNG